jgi:hypothetical protein
MLGTTESTVVWVYADDFLAFEKCFIMAKLTGLFHHDKVRLIDCMWNVMKYKQEI